LLEDDKKSLKMSASVAVSSSGNTSFEVGVGIVGNAATLRTLSITKGIPDDYWKIESGLGETSGKGQIVCMPLWVGANLKAVVELGNLNEFTDKQMLLLETVSNSLATAINARQSRLKITALLEKVQEQQEAMTQQHEELRQTNDELNRQAEALISSEEELKTQEEELRQMNSELQERNNTIDNAQQALIIKANELEATSKYKSEFLANMSHELRTPLNSVLILAKLLADNNLNNLVPKQVEYANIIHKSGSDLLQLINDILDLSKIEAGKVELVVEDIAIDAIVLDLKQLFTVVASEKEINYQINVSKDIPLIVKTDKQRVEQILKNLLSNAFKFTPKGGTVSISFDNRDQFNRKRIGISVADSGIGISPEKQQLIFEAFQQADGSTSRQYGGTGLGLSISKELARLLGGEIELKSEAGKGSCFTILLPHEIAIVANIEKEVLPEAVNTSLENVVEQNRIKDDRDQLNHKDRLMLIIEDDENFASILMDFARDKGYKVMVALKGDEGLSYAMKFHPAAIILDMQLPVIDGWSILKLLKADKELKNIPVHIISAFDDNQLHTSGALSYIKKPIDREGLEKAFENISAYLNEHIKKVLIVSSAHFKDDTLKQMFQEKQLDIAFTQVSSMSIAKQKIQLDVYDCLIVDIGDKVTEGINELLQLQEAFSNRAIPVIVYLDADISPADELQLKKISNIIVRESPAVFNRLKDELDLFLFKVSEVSAATAPDLPSQVFDINDTSLVGKKILLVDDDMRNVYALTNALESYKMLVTPASDGKESLNLLTKTPDFDLVLMDIMMPEMDGYEAMKRIRGDLKMQQIPIIALTAKAMTGDREKCIDAGASDYITKPVDIQKLLSLMRVWVSK
jgi:signal transduction histidine kinase/DNA-binding response OmpR family regulator